MQCKARSTVSLTVGAMAVVLTLCSSLLAQLELPADARSVVVPVERAVVSRALLDAASGLSFVKVRIGGRELSLILDTGAGVCVLDYEVAKALELQQTGRINALGSGGTVASPTFTIGELEVPTESGQSLRARNVTAIGLDLKGLRHTAGRQVDGILGSQVFAQTPFTLDLGQLRLLIHRADSFTAPEGVSEHPLIFALGVPCLRLQFAGLRPRWYTVDSGNAGTLLFHGPLVERVLGREEFEKLPATNSKAIGERASKVYFAKLAQFELGALQLRDLPVGLCDPEQPGLGANRSISGNIGSGLIARARWTFDYANSRCWIEAPTPRSVDAGPTVVEPSLGLHFREWRGRWVVGAVLDGSPASEAGIEPWDELVEIDGSAAPLAPDELVQRLRACSHSKQSFDVLRRPFAKAGKQAEASLVQLQARAWLKEVVLDEGRVRKNK